jgi:hypothetical protein
LHEEQNPPFGAGMKVSHFSEQDFGMDRERFFFITGILYGMQDESKFHKKLGI